MTVVREFTIKGNSGKQPYASLLALSAAGLSVQKSVSLTADGSTALHFDGITLTNDISIARLISASSKLSSQLLGQGFLEQAQIDEIVTTCELVLDGIVAASTLESLVPESKTSLVGKSLSLADFALFAVGHNDAKLQKKFGSIFEAVIAAPSLVAAHNSVGIYKTAQPAGKQPAVMKEKKKDEGKFVELPGAEKGKVVVRFPPEASGYLHIGHAKAALLNQYYQQAFEGQLIMRFDDTNPAKENAHFEEVIKEDLKLLAIVPDRWTHSSDHFDMLLGCCEKLLNEGKAYVDDTDTETMRKEREERAESKNRNNAPAKNLELWKEMKEGTEKGKACCVRIKIDMKSNNGAMRDPTIYRCKPEEHVRTGLKYKVYPTYDFTCPIVDSVEGVTHALRTTEYHDRDDQYYFICDALGLRRPYIWEYARLNMTNTVMSKRKLTWFVDEAHVEGWDDPRLPTVRGVMRRGLTVEGLKQFIVAQGGSRSVVMMEWDKIWAFNKKVIDPVAPRYTAIAAEQPVEVKLTDKLAVEKTQVALHPKNPEVGQKTIFKSNTLLLEQVDAKGIKVGDIVTFVNWGNVKINDVKKQGDTVVSIGATLNLENTDYKKTTKVTWIGKAPEGKTIPVVAADYDHIISKAIVGKDEDWKQFINYNSVHYTQLLGEPELASLKKGDIIQLQRKGFYIVDHPYVKNNQAIGGEDTPLLLVAIPDGSQKEAAPAAVKAATTAAPASNGLALYNQIEAQGTLVRELKGKDAKSQVTKDAIAKLLELKKQYKEATGSDHKPGSPPAAPAAAPATGASAGLDLYNQIEAQGNLVRELKGKDAKSQATKDAITKLLDLKKKYKEVTGSDHKPGAPPAAPVSAPAPSAGGALDVYNEIEAQGNLVRELKGKDAKSQATKDAIAKLLELKKKYKEVSGSDYKPGAPPAAPAAPVATVASSAGGALDVYNEIEAQGNLVRELKGKDAKSQATKDAIAKLLELKKKYKDVSGSDYKPGAPPAAATPAQVSAPAPSPGGALAVYNEIEAQGNLVRELKGKDAKSQATKDAIAKLLELKKKYKEVAGADYKPGAPPASAPAAPAAAPSSSNGVLDVYNQLEAQGNLVRELKGKDAKSQATKDAIAKLLELKQQYKTLAGTDYKAGSPPTVSAAPAPTASSSPGADISAQIETQGNLVRELKGKDAKSQATKDAIAKLLELKKKYKEVTGADYKPGAPAAAAPSTTPAPDATSTDAALAAEIEAQGAVVRELKAKDPKSQESADAINKLLKLKANYKKATGKDYQPAGGAPKQQQKPAKKTDQKPKPQQQPKKEEADGKKTKLGIETKKDENYSEWYSQVITKAEMIEYYDVSGCYVLRPWSYAIWEMIKKWFDTRIKRIGVKNCYFPMFVSQQALEREKEHIADFAPEVAWVTRAGQSEMAEPIAIRPTSETVMYPSYKKWVQSHRDLPIKLNQWCNVVRWEFKHPTPFLRTREFLWQEGHTAYANPADAEKEVFKILDLYAGVYQELLAVPVIKGKKSEKEKFAGGSFTTTIEAYVPVNGRGVQAATSHHLGQNFSKMFDISFEDTNGQRSFAWQNSWGLTTRTIGAMVMVHGDDLGLVLPPRVASIQAIVVPVGLTASTTPEQRDKVNAEVAAVVDALVEQDVRAESDTRDNYSPGWKFNHWELKGVPVRVEVGPKDIAANQVTAVIRHDGSKRSISRATLASDLVALLEEIHVAMFEKVKKQRDDHLKIVRDLNEFKQLLDDKFILLAPFCGVPDCEDNIKRDSTREDGAEGAQMGAKTLCIPLEQPTEALGDKCLHPDCKAKPTAFALFGRSY